MHFLAEDCGFLFPAIWCTVQLLLPNCAYALILGSSKLHSHCWDRFPTHARKHSQMIANYRDRNTLLLMKPSSEAHPGDALQFVGVRR
ncbi:unnamed protein product [Haemonchus placei]|uniref:Uncharacterized protein n=1 Tax=Haemonchus placei TaxID=6290 RepID=A0A3P7V7S0_HAEPC|nr:unnamed protein product [Haemonchus placei]